MRCEIRFAETDDLNALSVLDRHVSPAELSDIIERRRVIVAVEGESVHGWLRYGLFWDSLPFMNMLFVIDGERGKGIGTALCEYWERTLAETRCKLALTSTPSDERGQHFFRARGYKDCGSLILPREVTELILYKELL